VPRYTLCMNVPFFRHVRRGTLLAFAGGAILLSSVSAWAAGENARITHDLTVGAAHDIQLKADQMVQVLKRTAEKAVIMVKFADGSSGIFQVNSAAVEMVVTAAPAPAAPVVAIATTNAAPANVIAAPAASKPQPAATAPVSNAPPPVGQITRK